jgi:hypothetical protein
MSDSTVRARDPQVILEQKLAELENLVADAKAVPLSASIMVNRSEIDAILEEFRAAMPEEVKQARWLLKEREDVLAQAGADAEKLLDEAREQKRTMVSKTEVVQAAAREADRIVDDAKEHARQIRLEAEDYVDAKLANFEIVLAKTLKAVERGREKLRGRLDTEDLADLTVEEDDD